MKVKTGIFMGLALVMFFCFVMPASAVIVNEKSWYYEISTDNYISWISKSSGVLIHHASADGEYIYVSGTTSAQHIGKIITNDKLSRIDPTVTTAIVNITNNTDDKITITAQSNDGVINVTYDFYTNGFFVTVNCSQDYTFYNGVSADFNAFNSGGNDALFTSNYEMYTNIENGKIVFFNSTNPTTCSQMFMQWDVNTVNNIDVRSYEPGDNIGLIVIGKTVKIDHTKPFLLAVQTNEDRTIVTNNKYLQKTQYLTQYTDISKYGYNLGIPNGYLNISKSSHPNVSTWISSNKGYEHWWSCHEINPSQPGVFTDSLMSFAVNPDTFIRPVWSQDTGIYQNRTWNYFTDEMMTSFMLDDGSGLYICNVSTELQNTAPITVATHIPYSLDDLSYLENTVSSSQYVNISTVGKSVQNRDIKLYHITNSNSPYPVKKKIYIGAAIHAAGESATMYTVDGLIHSILSSQDALDKCDWYIIPCQNPDGVYIGSSRNNAHGVNLNRDWYVLTQPETIAIDSWLSENAPFDALFDIHNKAQPNDSIGWSAYQDPNFTEFQDMLSYMGFEYFPMSSASGTARVEWLDNGYGDTATVEFCPTFKHDGSGLKSVMDLKYDGAHLQGGIVSAYLSDPYTDMEFKAVPRNSAVKNNTVVINASGISKLTTSETFRSADFIHGFLIYPESDTVNVSVSIWTLNQKIWNLSSETQQSVTHTIGGFPASTDIQIKRDDVDYETVTSNETGYIEWVYDGGFSEHIFSIECHDFNASLTSGAYPLTTQFTTSSEGIDAYYWDFENDGIIDSTKQNPAHTYGQTGDYSVNLTVHTSEGNVSTVKPDYISVENPAFSEDPLAWFNWVFSYLFGRF